MIRSKSRWLAVVAALMLLFSAVPAPLSSYAQGSSRTFPETGFTVDGRFLEYWEANGGLAQQGYPISAEMQEVSPTDGKTYTVQYFERAVFEMHPENDEPFDVLLSLLGTFYLGQRHPNGISAETPNTSTGSVLFPETGKRVGGVFLKYWQEHGGLTQQGFPITDEFMERSDLDGKTYKVQYFQRAVFEHHPENAGGEFEVLLSQLGTFQHRKNHSPAGAPITVGALTDRSGALAIYGPMWERGFDLGLEYATGGTKSVMGHPINVVIKDTASNAKTGVNVAREAIERDGAKILAGVPSSGVALGVSSLAAQNKVLYVAGPAATPDLTGKNFSPYTFRAGRDSIQDALTMGAALTGLGDTFIQIAPDYAFGRGSAAAFHNVVKSEGGTFPVNDNTTDFGTVFAPQDTTDFVPYLNQILDSGADVVIVTWAGAGFVPLFQQMQQYGIFDSMVVATGMGDNQTLAQGYADAVGSVGVSVYHYSMFTNPVNGWFVQEYNKRHRVPPDLFSESGFIAAQMIVRALEATNGDTTADKLITALEGLEFDGPKGNYKIRPEDHALLQPMTLVKLITTDDPEYKFFELVTLFKPEETAPPCAVPAELNRCK